MKALAGFCGIVYVGALPMQAEVDSEIPLGIEAVTGIRSDYVHRGFRLARSLLDFQLEAEISLSNETSLHLGFAHLAESAGSFTETASYLELNRSFNKRFRGGASFTYRDRDASILRGGFDLGFFTFFTINDEWRWRNELNIDLGVEGTYLNSELEWSRVISSKSFITVQGGLSSVSSYLDRSGLNDFHARIAYTYAISDQISFTPFLGSSLQIEDRDADDIIYAGLWFEVIF
jgi:hypothetical protein